MARERLLVRREVVLPFMDAGPLEILLEERTEVRAESSSGPGPGSAPGSWRGLGSGSRPEPEP
eukprot:scaffold34336_cov27-Phaeocystis_antarctica.AAC.1